MTLLNILLTAAKTTWKHKKLWPLGLLISAPLALQNEWQIFKSIFAAVAIPQDYFWFFHWLSLLATPELTWGNLFSTIKAAPIDFIIIIAQFILLVTILFLLSWVVVNAQGIIIYIFGNKKSTAVKLPAALNYVAPLWLSILILNISFNLSKLVVISLLLGLIIITANNFLFSFWWLAIIAGVIMMMILSFILRFSLYELILNRLTILPALKNGYALGKKYLLECFEFSFILAIINFGILEFIRSIINSFMPANQSNEIILGILLFQKGWWLFILLSLSIIFIIGLFATLAIWQYIAWLNWYHEIKQDSVLTSSFIKKIIHRLKNKIKKRNPASL